jgi:hypothetical protein
MTDNADLYSKMLHGKDSKRIARDTYVRRNDTDIVVQFHKTFVVRIKPDGTHVLDTGGWRTPSVKTRINMILRPLGWTIVQEDHVWFLQKDQLRYLFVDGCMILPDGKVKGASGKQCLFRNVNSLIDKYVSGFMREWKRGDVPPPCAGDPFNVYMICSSPLEKKSIAEADKPELQHFVLQYMRGQYYFGSLLMVAIEDAGGAGKAPLHILDKTHVEQWLKDGAPAQSRLLETKNLGKILRGFLKKLFDLE